ncbi:MAG: hypothetical protein CVV49_05030 [Spirochaetae bacterium HGW-Spirochaetae-5]|nr:MAG: hypothetical protein CVV49_05030 [Spirochaetae bacterium HGW-Spirochaetae-5]
MDSADKKIINNKSSSIMTSGEAVDSRKPDASAKFDMSILGKIDLIEAEKIASEEVLFLSEADLIDGLEDFELVPVKNYRQETESPVTSKNIVLNDVFIETKASNVESEPLILSEISIENDYSSVTETHSDKKEQLNDFIVNTDLSNKNSGSEDLLIEKSITEDSSIEDSEVEDSEVEDLAIDKTFSKSGNKEFAIQSQKNDVSLDDKLTDEDTLFTDSSAGIDEIIRLDTIEFIPESNDAIPDAKKLFSIKINEETLDAQLFSILNDAAFAKIDEKALEKYSETDADSKCRFADDQFLNKKIQEDTVSYNEDLLTERLVKMIEVADGKMELLEITAKEGEYSSYILEDYTLYSSEKFDTVFKEEVFYNDSDFEFIENAIIRDDFTKYIHEIDDYFESEDSLIQSEISEILGLIPDEKEYIEDKLFGDYYKKFDLDNEIDFIKPEIDFFRSNYSGTKNLNYFTKSENSISEDEKKSIEEDISSANAIVFEEDIAEIEEILFRDFNYKPEDAIEKVLTKDVTPSVDELPDITDKIIILEDKEKLFELVSEFPDKHENLIKLLSYLDGLFEKLPEEVIRKFAESEYFDLYSKVLKEIGV